MGKKTTWADIPAGHDNPLSYAVTARDYSIIEMVNQAVQHKQVMLAFQAVVPSAQQNQPAFRLTHSVSTFYCLLVQRQHSKRQEPVSPNREKAFLS